MSYILPVFIQRSIKIFLVPFTKTEGFSTINFKFINELVKQKNLSKSYFFFKKKLVITIILDTKLCRKLQSYIVYV